MLDSAAPGMHCRIAGASSGSSCSLPGPAPRRRGPSRTSGSRLDGERRRLGLLALRDAFDRRLRERLESGLPTRSSTASSCTRDRKRWYDRRLEATTLEVVAMYDAVTRDYTVHFKLDDKLIESRTVRERQALWRRR